MTARRELPAELGDVFSVGAALASGVSARRLDALDLRAPFRGSRARVVPPPVHDTLWDRLDFELRERCAAYLPVAPADVAFSHVTAARLYRMPVPSRLETTDLDVSTAGQPPRRAGVRAHKVRDARRSSIGTLPVIPPELAWLQLAPLLSADELIVAGDHIVRRKSPLGTLDSLAAELDRARGQRGVAAARLALRQVRPRTDSPRETWMRLIIVRAGFPEPVVGYAAHHDGYFMGTPDLAYPEYRIAFEYQGDGHRERDVFEHDITRLELFHEADWIVIQVTNKLLWQPNWLAERTRRALLTRGWTPSTQL